MPADKEGPAELSEAQRNGLVQQADDVLRTPASQSKASYLSWFNGPVRKLVSQLLGVPPMLRRIEANATPAIRVPSAWKTKTHQVENSPDVVHSPIWVTTTEYPEHPVEAESLAGMRAAAFLQSSGANVLLVLFHCFAEKGDAIPTWPGLYELPEQPLNEQVSFTLWIKAMAHAYVATDVISSDGARRTYIRAIVHGLRWLRRELGEDSAHAEPWPELRDFQANLADGLRVLDACHAADGTYPDDLAKLRYRAALAEAGDIRARSGVALPSLPEDATDPHGGLVRLHDWCTAALQQVPPEAFPYWRSCLALLFSLLLEAAAFTVVLKWGKGDNPVQKIGNYWEPLAAVFAFSILFWPFIRGKDGWFRIKKWWRSWWGET